MNTAKRLRASSGVRTSYVDFTTTGSSFTPAVELSGGSAATVHWTVVGGSSTTGLTPTLSFGSSATRHVRMTATGGGGLSDITTLNLGFDHTNDAGTYNMGSGYDKAAESVTAISGLPYLRSLIRFAAANTPLAGSLDFTGLSSLQYIECYQAYVNSVSLTGCTSLIRLCLENCDLTSPLNLNPVAANVKDIRAARQKGGAITLSALSANLAQAYHLCLRDQTVTGMPAASRLPVVEQLWIWNTAQSGTLTVTSSAITSLMAYSNAYTAVNISGRTTLTEIDLHGNSLNQGAVDGVLVEVESWHTSNGALNLLSTAVPSSTGQTADTALTGRSWTVSVDSSAVGVHSDNFERANATGIANIGNDWFALLGADANIVSGDLVRPDTGGYRLVLNPGGQDLPANYTVTASIPGTTPNGTSGTYYGIVGRWASGNGVAAMFAGGSGSADLHIFEAANFLQNDATLTPIDTFPASSWSNTGIDHTFAMRMSGTTVTVILDGVEVYSATVSVNSSATGTGYGICGEGQGRAWHSIGTTVP